jgi:hypothetical protein
VGLDYIEGFRSVPIAGDYLFALDQDAQETYMDNFFFAIILLVMVADNILLVVLGQKTVRKLRKNPATKNALGIQFIGGWDIGNVMMALALPEKITRLRKGSPLAALTADSELLKKHTTHSIRSLQRYCARP